MIKMDTFKEYATKEIKISVGEGIGLIRKNGYPQIVGDLVRKDSSGSIIGACAMGQLALNYDSALSPHLMESAFANLQILLAPYLASDKNICITEQKGKVHPWDDTCWGINSPIANFTQFVEHLNDVHNASLTQISDILDDLLASRKDEEIKYSFLG